MRVIFSVLLLQLQLLLLVQQARSYCNLPRLHYKHQQPQQQLKQQLQQPMQLQVQGGPEIIDPSSNLAMGSAAIGATLGILSNFKSPTATFFGLSSFVVTLFGGFLAYQTATLRFQFDETHFSLVKTDGSRTDANVVVGGENSWKYESFVNWDFLPSEDFPLLVYFKETQTPITEWIEAPIVVDNLKGQAHFFPAIADVQQLKKSFLKYNCKRITTSAAATTSNSDGRSSSSGGSQGSSGVRLQLPAKLTL